MEWLACLADGHAHNEPEGLIVDYLDTSDIVFFVIEGEVRVTIYSASGKVVSFRELGPGNSR